MKIIEKINEMTEIKRQNIREGKTVGLVPTMGCLHEGHRSLIKKARENNDIVVVSVFVNPTQFGPGEDYESYPRDLKRDAEICREEGADYVFHPSPEEMYPDGFSTFAVPGENMTNVMCGISRPIHFRGVCTVLTKLFNIISPNNAYFGEKDIQQLAIVKRMVKDMNFDIEITGCPIVREEDGLAKSSRNKYLSAKERKAATVLRRSIIKAEEMISEGEKDAVRIKAAIIETIENEPLAKIDYVEILNFDTFERLKEIEGKVLIGIAVFIGSTRLIDNMVFN